MVQISPPFRDATPPSYQHHHHHLPPTGSLHTHTCTHYVCRHQSRKISKFKCDCIIFYLTIIIASYCSAPCARGCKLRLLAAAYEMNECLMVPWKKKRKKKKARFQAARQFPLWEGVGRWQGYAGGRPPRRVPGLWGGSRPRVKPSLTLSHQMLSY